MARIAFIGHVRCSGPFLGNRALDGEVERTGEGLGEWLGSAHREGYFDMVAIDEDLPGVGTSEGEEERLLLAATPVAAAGLLRPDLPTPSDSSVSRSSATEASERTVYLDPLLSCEWVLASHSSASWLPHHSVRPHGPSCVRTSQSKRS